MPLHPNTSEHIGPVKARMPIQSLMAWTFGRGTVIWRIWPAVMLHTVFAAIVVTLDMKKYLALRIPSVMLTVLGVVIGFVISYRAMSGYDRYWMGKTCWSAVIKNTRSLGRLIWFHVPTRLSPKTPEEIQANKTQRAVQEIKQVMAEKTVVLDLVEGFAVALKHHIRGELGIYYDDLYYLIKPLHDHGRSTINHEEPVAERATAIEPSPHPRLRPTRLNQQITMPFSTEATSLKYPNAATNIADSSSSSESNPIIPPINAYGTFLQSHPSLYHIPSSSPSNDHHQPLLVSNPTSHDSSIIAKVSNDLIPFGSFLSYISALSSGKQSKPTTEGNRDPNDPLNPYQKRFWRGPVHCTRHLKYQDEDNREGESLPLAILGHLSNWLSILEDRGTVAGTSLGEMISTVASLEENLTTLESILTTPLPYVYAVHIRTVWLYLFFLPFQLIEQFGWFTIPGVAMAAFIYLGFMAAGEEIEQPFGYDENDLELELFCRVIHTDMRQLKNTPCINAYFEPRLQRQPDIAHRASMSLVELSGKLAEDDG